MVGVVCPSIVYFFDINIYHLTGETSSWVHHLLKAKIQRWSLADTEAANQMICFGNTRAWKLSTQDFQLRCSAITLVLHHWSNFINFFLPPPIWLGATAGKVWHRVMKLSSRVLVMSLQENHPDLHPPVLLTILLQLEMETIATYAHELARGDHWYKVACIYSLVVLVVNCYTRSHIYILGHKTFILGISTLKYSSPYVGWDSTRQMHRSYKQNVYTDSHNYGNTTVAPYGEGPYTLPKSNITVYAAIFLMASSRTPMLCLMSEAISCTPSLVLITFTLWVYGS